MVVLRKSKVLILMGGVSSERLISIKTGNQVYGAIKDIYDVKKILVSKNIKKLIDILVNEKPNFIFNALHGRFGEDGQLQSILNSLKIPYTHSGVLSSALAMNKYLAKIVFKSRGINCPHGILVNSQTIKNHKIGYPFIIKPNNGGSSIDMHIIRNKKDKNKLNLFFEKNELGLVEEYIPGREITVGIFNNKVCGITEIVFSDLLYDYNKKYLNVAKHSLNPIMPNSIKKKFEEYSISAHRILGCNFLSRVDFKYNEKNKKIYILEVNTQPGLTKNSLLPEMLSKKRINFQEMCHYIIQNSSCELS